MSRYGDAWQDHQLRLILKKPDYYYSFSGFFIFRQWYVLNGLNQIHAEILVIVSYYEYFLNVDKRYWNFHRNAYVKNMDQLIKMGYIARVNVPGKSRMRQRLAYVLTKKGKDMEADYEKFYDTKMEEFRKKKYGKTVSFKDGKPFRRERKPMAEIRTFGKATGMYGGGAYLGGKFEKYNDNMNYDETEPGNSD